MMAEQPPQPPTQQYYAPTPQAPSSGLAIAALVLGIVSLVLICVPYLGLPCAVVAIVLGFVARSKAASGTAGGRGMATAGIICGGISIVLAILVLIGAIAFFSWARTQPEFQKAFEEAERQQERMRQGLPPIDPHQVEPVEPSTPGEDSDSPSTEPDSPSAGLSRPVEICSWII